ncbi:MAG: class I SAM-dependent methyltransferase [Pseudomonadota bacterium]
MNVDQRARAGLQFLGSLQVFSSTELQQQAETDFDDAVEAPVLTRDFQQDTDRNGWLQRIDQAREVVERSPAFRFNRLYQRYVAEENWVRAITGVERRREVFTKVAPTAPPASDPRLHLNPELEMPDYYQGVEWHLQPGGLDGYDLSAAMAFSGFIPYVFARGGFAAVAVGDNLLQQRRDVIQQFRSDNLKCIYDPGCGGSGTLGLCRERFPDAKLIGGDLSAQVLINGLKFSDKTGIPVELWQEDARQTSQAGGSVDGVISYALHHELPPEVSVDVLKEMFRILEPGGEMVISDPPPFRAVGPFQAVMLDWETENRSEPYFTEAGIFNLAQAMSEIGFVDVEEYPLQDTRYPWVTRGRKPR